jgi:hypothetical protein
MFLAQYSGAQDWQMPVIVQIVCEVVVILFFCCLVEEYLGKHL